VQDVAAPAEARKQAPSLPLRVLAVDDDRDTVLSLTVLLRTEGYDVQGLHDARDILRHIRDFDPDVVILDIAMPGKTGWQAAAEIRAAVPGKRLTLVGLSGEYTSGAHRSVSQIRGFDFYLMKPCDPNVLFTLLRWVGIQPPFRRALR
jgi:DNA-binding response OmpR family regulator